MASSTKDIDKGYKAFRAELQRARNATVEIGIHADKFNAGLSVAEYGAYNEFGTVSIPERSFMRSTFDEKQSQINADMAKRYKQVIDGKIGVHRALSLIGMRHAQDIQDKIGSNIQPANSEATIARKKSTKTLIDTGAMRQSIRHMVKL